MSAQLNNDYLQAIINNQAAMQSTVTDAYALRTRYVFNPFLNRELSLLQMQSLGLPELTAGVILPLTRFNMQDMDYRQIMDVPTDRDGNFVPVNEGVSETKLFERRPADVIAAIYDIFNRHHHVDQTQDNGIREVESLRGNDDMGLLLKVNRYCLPQNYKTAREQLTGLERAVANAPEAIYEQVAEELYTATLQARNYCEWYYAKLESDMEDKARTGKVRLDVRDMAVCRWIEKAPPKFRSNLAAEAQLVGQGQYAVAPSRPVIQCENCGAESNLLADGRPPKRCSNAGCGEPFPVVAQSELPIGTSGDWNPENPMDEDSTSHASGKVSLEQKQAELRAKNQQRRR